MKNTKIEGFNRFDFTVKKLTRNKLIVVKSELNIIYV